MNYIQSLKAQNEALKKALANANSEIYEFINFLHSDKFTGVQADGSRKDWISTADVIHRMRDMGMQLSEAQFEILNKKY